MTAIPCTPSATLAAASGPIPSLPSDPPLYLGGDLARTVYLREPDTGTFREVGTLDVDARGPNGELVVTLRPELPEPFEGTVRQVPDPGRPSCASCGAVLTEDGDGNCLVCGGPGRVLAPTEPLSATRLRLAARALYGMDDARVLPRVTPEHLRTASRRLGWTLAREATQRLYANRAFELWTKDGRTADLPVTKGDDYRWPRDVAGWATCLAGIDIAPCEALALALEEVLP